MQFNGLLYTIPRVYTYSTAYLLGAVKKKTVVCTSLSLLAFTYVRISTCTLIFFFFFFFVKKNLLPDVTSFFAEANVVKVAL